MRKNLHATLSFRCSTGCTARQLVLIGREIIRMKGTPARLVGHVFAADRA